MREAHCSVLVVVLAAMFHGCGTAPSLADAMTVRTTTVGDWTVTERRLKLGKFNPRQPAMTASPDMRRFSYGTCVKTGLGDRMIVDGSPQKQYDSVYEATFSPDSKRYGYAAELDGKHFAIIDGVEGPAYEGDIYEVMFSPDSKRVAYAAAGMSDCTVVVDGKATHYNGFFHSHSLAFSGDSQHIYYAVREDKQVVVYRDGQKWFDADEVETFAVKPAEHGPDAAVTFRRGIEWFVAYGKRMHGPYEKVDEILLAISPDGRRLAIPAMIDQQWFLLCDNERWGPFEHPPSGVFSPDSKRVLGFGVHGEKAVPVFLDGQPLATMQEGHACRFSPDSKHTVVTGVQHGRNVMLVDGPGDTEEFAEITWSPDASRMVRIERVGKKERLVEGDRKGELHDGVAMVCFSPDSRHLAYDATDGLRHAVIINGREVYSVHGSMYSELAFGDDGRLAGIAFATSEADARWFVEQPFNAVTFGLYLDKVRLVLFELGPAEPNKQ